MFFFCLHELNCFVFVLQLDAGFWLVGLLPSGTWRGAGLESQLMGNNKWAVGAHVCRDGGWEHPSAVGTGLHSSRFHPHRSEDSNRLVEGLLLDLRVQLKQIALASKMYEQIKETWGFYLHTNKNHFFMFLILKMCKNI